MRPQLEIVEPLGQLERLLAPLDSRGVVATEHPQVRLPGVRDAELAARRLGLEDADRA